MERTGIEPVTSDLQIPGFRARLGQIRSVNVKLRWLGAVEIGYSGTRFGTRFRVPRAHERSAAGRSGVLPCAPQRDFVRYTRVSSTSSGRPRKMIVPDTRTGSTPASA